MKHRLPKQLLVAFVLARRRDECPCARDHHSRSGGEIAPMAKSVITNLDARVMLQACKATRDAGGEAPMYKLHGARRYARQA